MKQKTVVTAHLKKKYSEIFTLQLKLPTLEYLAGVRAVFFEGYGQYKQPFCWYVHVCQRLEVQLAVTELSQQKCKAQTKSRLSR